MHSYTLPFPLPCVRGSHTPPRLPGTTPLPADVVTCPRCRFPYTVPTHTTTVTTPVTIGTYTLHRLHAHRVYTTTFTTPHYVALLRAFWVPGTFARYLPTHIVRTTTFATLTITGLCYHCELFLRFVVTRLRADHIYHRLFTGHHTTRYLPVHTPHITFTLHHTDTRYLYIPVHRTHLVTPHGCMAIAYTFPDIHHGYTFTLDVLPYVVTVRDTGPLPHLYGCYVACSCHGYHVTHHYGLHLVDYYTFTFTTVLIVTTFTLPFIYHRFLYSYSLHYISVVHITTHLTL